jgi:hypothetical protein
VNNWFHAFCRNANCVYCVVLWLFGCSQLRKRTIGRWGQKIDWLIDLSVDFPSQWPHQSCNVENGGNVGVIDRFSLLLLATFEEVLMLVAVMLAVVPFGFTSLQNTYFQ